MCGSPPANYDVHKESTIQVFTGPIQSDADGEEEKAPLEHSVRSRRSSFHSVSSGISDDEVIVLSDNEEKDAKEKDEKVEASLDGADDDTLPDLKTRPFMVRQPTDESVQYGDILVVKLISAKNLIAVDWNGSSDPYALIAIDKQVSRSTMIKRNLNPIWNETFFFHGQSKMRILCGMLLLAVWGKFLRHPMLCLFILF